MKAATADYICFSDQDDVWLPDKVSRTKQAMDQLESRWGPRSRCLCLPIFTWSMTSSKIVHESFWSYMNIDPGRINRLSETDGTKRSDGLHRDVKSPLVELSMRMPEEAYMHDLWISWLASFHGESGLVKAQTVLYRQHGAQRHWYGQQRRRHGVPAPTRSWWERIRRPRIAAGHVFRWEIGQRQARAFPE